MFLDEARLFFQAHFPHDSLEPRILRSNLKPKVNSQKAYPQPLYEQLNLQEFFLILLF